MIEQEVEIASTGSSVDCISQEVPCAQGMWEEMHEYRPNNLERTEDSAWWEDFIIQQKSEHLEEAIHSMERMEGSDAWEDT